MLLLTLLVGGVAVERAGRESNDFDGFHRAAVQVAQQRSLSLEKSVERYLPSFSVLLSPLGWLPLQVAASVWFLLNLCAIAGLPRELQRLSGVPPAGQRAAFLVALPFLVNDLGLGQSGPLLLWLATAGVARCVGVEARDERSAALFGGGLLALAAALKLLPAGLLVVPLLLAGPRRRLASLAGFVGAGVLVAGLCVWVLGSGPAWEGLTRWRTEMFDQTPARMVLLDRSLRHGNQSLWIASWRTFGDTSSVRVRDWPRVASLPDDVVWTAVSLGLAGLMALGAAAARSARRRLASAATANHPAADAAAATQRGGAALASARDPPDAFSVEPGLQLFALACLGMLFVSPLVWTHYFLWLLPGVLALRQRPRLVMWAGWAFVLGLASPALRSLGWHMAFAVALFVLLALDVLRAGRARR